MNSERLKQLELLAYIDVDREWMDPRSNYVETIKTREFSREKFAELIIKECVSVCDILENEGVWHGIAEEHGNGTVASAADCSFYIKTRFGVE